MFDIEQAKQNAQPYPYQDILDKLVAHGFAVIDEAATYRWFDENGNSLMYKFTPEGKRACFRYCHSLPMAWAEDIQKGARHCVVCGRDCHRKKVWVQDKNRCVCMACAGEGHDLPDLAQNEQEKQEAVEIMQAFAAMDVHAKRQARAIKQEELKAKKG